MKLEEKLKLISNKEDSGEKRFNRYAILDIFSLNTNITISSSFGRVFSGNIKELSKYEINEILSYIHSKGSRKEWEVRNENRRKS